MPVNFVFKYNRNFLLLIFLLLQAANLHGQCYYKNSCFKSGETVSYNVYYKLGFLWFNAAEVTFSVNTVIYNNKPAYKFTSTGRSLPNYDWIFKVHNSYVSLSDTSELKSLFFSRQTNEGDYSVNNHYRFDYKRNKIYSVIQNSKTPKYNDTLKLKKCTYDMLTAVYACRNINFKKLKNNDTIVLKMLVDNKIYNLYLRYLSKDKVKQNDSLLYNCRRFSALMIEGTIFSGGEDLQVWISDDKARIPVKIVANILIGSVVAKVNEIQGNKIIAIDKKE
jgi:hypothetical protein